MVDENHQHAFTLIIWLEQKVIRRSRHRHCMRWHIDYNHHLGVERQLKPPLLRVEMVWTYLEVGLEPITGCAFNWLAIPYMMPVAIHIRATSTAIRAIDFLLICTACHLKGGGGGGGGGFGGGGGGGGPQTQQLMESMTHCLVQR